MGDVSRLKLIKGVSDRGSRRAQHAAEQKSEKVCVVGFLLICQPTRCSVGLGLALRRSRGCSSAVRWPSVDAKESALSRAHPSKGRVMPSYRESEYFSSRITQKWNSLEMTEVFNSL